MDPARYKRSLFARHIRSVAGMHVRSLNPGVSEVLSCHTHRDPASMRQLIRLISSYLDSRYDMIVTNAS